MTETSAQADGDLRGARILIVEDEYYLADDLAKALLGAGLEVVGPLPSLAEAETAVRAGDFDGAVLDMNLRGDNAFSIADSLETQGTPYVIVTGYDTVSLPERLAHAPRLEKPVDADKIVQAVRTMLRRSS